MSDVTRMWLLVPAHLNGALVLPAQLELAGVVAGTQDQAAAGLLAEAHGGQLHLDDDLVDSVLLATALTRWARKFARAQCALVCPPTAVQRTVGEALGVGDPACFELAAGGSATVDWPLDEGAAPALVGLDLDWTPVFLGTGRPKFPGGPGVASSGRS